MELLRTPFVLLLVFCSPRPSAGKTFWTHLGTPCIEACESDGGEYKCKTIDKDEKCQTMYCSPEENMDYKGRQCSADSVCDQHGNDYYWCQIDLIHWGYCGHVMDHKNHYGSYYEVPCYDYCDQRNEDYYWCHTEKGWDYCSPSENTDYKNKQCKDDSPCEKRSKNYNWCWLKEGDWGYCGLVEPKMFLYWTLYDRVCIDECQYYESKDYYWCHTAHSWDYCSPEVGVTYKGKPCRSDHFCGSHGSNYNWCRTSQSWDYCGPIESEECAYIASPHRSRRAPKDKKEKEILICTKDDKHNKKVTTFSELPVDNTRPSGFAEVNNALRAQASNIIGQWHNWYLRNQATSNLITEGNVRIDMQGMENRNNRRYYNIQVQLNQARNRESTTIAQVLVPDGVPARYIRRGLLESMNRRARIAIDVEQHQC